MNNLSEIIRKYTRKVLFLEEVISSETIPVKNYFSPEDSHEDEYEFEKLGYVAQFFRDGYQSYWEIFEYDELSDTRTDVGILWWNGDLEIDLGNRNFITINDFGTNLENATRFVWLKRQQSVVKQT